MTEHDSADPSVRRPPSGLAPLPSGPVQRIVFLGTPEIAAQVLGYLSSEGFDIGLVVTPPDKRRGRGSALVPTPVKKVALELGIPVVHGLDHVLEEHRRRPFDLGVVVAYGVLITKDVLATLPMVNLHVSLLPRWRGAAPIERAILAGDRTTGVCVMQLEEGLDTGGVVASTSMEIGDSTTAMQIRERMALDGSVLLATCLEKGLSTPHPQEGEVTYARKIESHERQLDWTESSVQTWRRVRIGGAWTYFRNRRLKILEVDREDSGVALRVGEVRSVGVGSLEDRIVVGCAEGNLQLVRVQPEGKPALTALDWARGARLQQGEVFTRG